MKLFEKLRRPPKCQKLILEGIIETAVHRAKKSVSEDADFIAGKI
jgi:hypothetical protein